MTTIDLHKLRSELEYDKETGTFTWKIAKQGGKPAGTIAGTTDKQSGRVRIGFDNRIHHGHRLAWAYVHGNLPATDAVQAKNGNYGDIRLENLYLKQGGNRRSSISSKPKKIAPSEILSDDSQRS
jgi:hypothetical protein